MKLSLTRLPDYKCRPGWEIYQFFFNGIKIPVQRDNKGVWKTWLECLKEDSSIELTTLGKEDAEKALSKLLMLHFGPLITMLREAEKCTISTSSTSILGSTSSAASIAPENSSRTSPAIPAGTSTTSR